MLGEACTFNKGVGYNMIGIAHTFTKEMGPVMFIIVITEIDTLHYSNR